MGHPSVIIAVSVTVSAYFAPDGDSVAPNPATDLGVAEPSVEAPHDDDALIQTQSMPRPPGSDMFPGSASPPPRPPTISSLQRDATR